MLKKMIKKLRAKFHAITPSCSMVKISRLDNAFLEVFKLPASPVEGHTLQKKEKKRRQRKGEKDQKSKSQKTYVTIWSKNSKI